MVVASIFSGIWSGFEHIVVGSLNYVIAAFAYDLSAILSALPDLPALPTLPSSFAMAEGWVAWVFPVHQVALIITTFTTLWFTWLAISIALRWVKVKTD